jgi:hypothetical protein
MSAANYETFGAGVNEFGAGLSLYEGAKKGGLYGSAQAATSGVRLGAETGLLGSNAGTLAGEAGNVLGIVGGIEAGGISGAGQAGINAAQLGARAGAFGAASSEVGTLAGEAAIPLSVYNFAKNWRSGATGSDALSGAAAGASIGSVLPGVGTLIGALAGGAIGAASSIFGPGKNDPETLNWDSYAAAYQTHGAAGVAGATPAQNFQMLAGIFDARGTSIPFFNQFGRMGENQFMDAMAQKINQAASSGAILKTDSPSQIYSKVVEPWINSMSPNGWQPTSTIQGVPEKAAIGNLLTSLIGDYTSGQLNAQTAAGISGQTIPNLPAYQGPAIGANAATSAALGAAPTLGTNPAPTGPGYAPGPIMPRMKGPGALSSPSGASMPTTSPRQYQTNDPLGIGATGPMPTDSSGNPVSSDTSGGAGPFGMSPLATTGLLTGIGLLGAGYAQNQSNQTIKPITAVGAPYVGAGQTELGMAMNNQLTPQQSQVVNTAQSQGQSLIQAATPVGQIAQGLYQQFQSGTSSPGTKRSLTSRHRPRRRRSPRCSVRTSIRPRSRPTTTKSTSRRRSPSRRC